MTPTPKPKLKFAWHVHHEILVEPLTAPIKNRIAYIKAEKPKEEQKLRLRLLKIVRGKLPMTQRWEKANAKLKKAYAEREKAYAKLKKADAEWKKAYAERSQRYAQDINALHQKECKNCPWDGTTIFSKK